MAKNPAAPGAADDGTTPAEQPAPEAVAAPEEQTQATEPTAPTEQTATRGEPAAAKQGASKDQAAPKQKTKGSVAGEKSRLHQRYLKEVVPALQREFNYQNPMRVPRVAKVTVNVGIGEAIANRKALDATVRDVSTITGQKPLIKKARKSIAQFKLREGMEVGVMVTMRGERMWEFLDRLMNAALPRTRDFRGVPARSFDGRGNYTLGLREQLIFPEINYDQVDKTRGLEVSVVTTARTDPEARRLLELLGMPFQREDGSRR